MDENGKVRPNCANAANPYHVCGAYCLEKIADGKGYKEKDKKILDNRYGIKEVVRNKRTDDGGRSQPNCPKASNPYHECNDNCTQRSSKANIQGVRKESDNHNGIKQSELRKKKGGEGRVHQNCGKASNPYHECDENCFNRITEAKKESGSKFIDDSRSFDRKKKGSESQPKSPRALEITPALGAIYHGDPNSLESHLYREKLEANIRTTKRGRREYHPGNKEVNAFFLSFCNFEMFKFQQLVKKLKTRENHYNSLAIIPGSICHSLTCLGQISQKDN